VATPGQVDHHDRVSNDAVIGWIREIVLDCAEPWALARFWAGLLGGTPVQWYPGWVTLEPPPHGQRLSFQAQPPGLAGLRSVAQTKRQVGGVHLATPVWALHRACRGLGIQSGPDNCGTSDRRQPAAKHQR